MWPRRFSAPISSAARTSATSTVLAQIGAEAGLDEKTLQTFRETRDGDTVLAGSEERLRGFGVRTVPNLLFGGRVLVPGTVNVATYVHALDQALFPDSEDSTSEGEAEAEADAALRTLAGSRRSGGCLRCALP